jgi:hypothetical protein
LTDVSEELIASIIRMIKANLMMEAVSSSDNRSISTTLEDAKFQNTVVFQD